MIIIDNMKENDWEQVHDIFIEGINTGNATFEKEAPSWEAWNKKYLEDCRLVVRDGDKVIGWAALLSTSTQKAYHGVAELSIYLGSESKGRGIGTSLLIALIKMSEAHGFWTLQSGIFIENSASIHLHEKAGFRKVGVRKRVGKLNGVWRDVMLMERRSEVVGVD
ncbi:GNAT family N-acetyltransferase [Oceanobacillus sp. 143]|uniref:N-acetyltransferase n=1 Tax=Oceanobacillus zhaokaii TaxID=2052660 RepID=A0A345PCY4_9BACI|nr:GNAT family N-acetyltransferase [Oceanobacillus zhaokaii]AXI07864.1 N-acetyltransferase [Oceanobacillus zhaokaii]QGS67954.1 GNAT family N-acetyltransferase [Oceanobacillus sp. 143]